MKIDDPRDLLLWRICVVSLTLAAWLFILVLFGALVGGLILYGDLSQAIGSLTEAADNLARASDTVASTAESLAEGPNLVRTLVDLVAALIDLFE